MRAQVLIAALLVAAVAQAQSPVPPATELAEQASQTNMALVIRAGDLGFRTVVLEINGIKAAELKAGESYTGVWSPGRLQFTFPGDAAWKPVDTFAIANEEHVYELRFVTTRKAGEILGRSQPGLVLQQRNTTVAGIEPPPPPKPQAIPVTDLQGAQKQVIAKRSDPGAWRELGRYYLAAGESGKAARAYRQALRLKPDDAEALEALAAIESTTGKK